AQQIGQDLVGRALALQPGGDRLSPATSSPRSRVASNAGLRVNPSMSDSGSSAGSAGCGEVTSLPTGGILTANG
ncbi:hypothetical protein, partial [Porphyrobacter sp. AAP82]|uniref:hypothetical protein n=1 Tax=Porphyrobacter sp. AAP82 TaxID=1248917 RepID=UPI001F2EF744